MEIKVFLLIQLSTIFIGNYLLSRIFGLAPFLGGTKKLSSSAMTGLAATFVMTLTTVVAFLAAREILVPYDLVFLKTPVFILAAVILVRITGLITAKAFPVLYRDVGVYLPLLALCSVLSGAAALNSGSGFMEVDSGLLKSAVQGFWGGAAFLLSLVIMAGISERLELARAPEILKGLPIAFLYTGLMALAFLGFSGIKI
jgi:electron transport complex protein RnfA